MSSQTVLRRLKKLVKQGAWLMSEHAFDRAEERGGLHVIHVENALLEAYTAERQQHGTYVVEGPDLNGLELRLIVEIQDHVLVVTVLG